MTRDFPQEQRELRAKRRERYAGTPSVEAAGCPTCGASGDDPCVTPSGKVKDTWHAKRSS